MSAVILFILFILLITLPIWISQIFIILTPKITKYRYEAKRAPILIMATILWYVVYPLSKKMPLEQNKLILVLICLIICLFLLCIAFKKADSQKYLLKEKSINKKNYFLKGPLIGLSVLSLIVIPIIVFINPLSETMVCNKDYVCTVKQDFLFGIKKSKQYEVDSNSTIELHHYKETRYHKHYSPANSTYSYIDKNKKRFYPFISSDSVRDCYEWWIENDEQMFKAYNEKKKAFDKYILNPSNQYYTSSAADSIKTFDILLIYLIICIAFYFLLIYCYDNETIKK